MARESCRPVPQSSVQSKRRKPASGKAQSKRRKPASDSATLVTADVAEANMIRNYTGNAVDKIWASAQKGITVLIPGSFWGKKYKTDSPYRGKVLEYDADRADNGPFFVVKLDCDQDSDVDYLLSWENIVKYADKSDKGNKELGHAKEIKFINTSEQRNKESEGMENANGNGCAVIENANGNGCAAGDQCRAPKLCVPTDQGKHRCAHCEILTHSAGIGCCKNLSETHEDLDMTQADRSMDVKNPNAVICLKCITKLTPQKQASATTGSRKNTGRVSDFFKGQQKPKRKAGELLTTKKKPRIASSLSDSNESNSDSENSSNPQQKKRKAGNLSTAKKKQQITKPSSNLDEFNSESENSTSVYAMLDEKHKREWNCVKLEKQVGKTYTSSVYKYVWKCYLDRDAVRVCTCQNGVIQSLSNPAVGDNSTDFS